MATKRMPAHAATSRIWLADMRVSADVVIRSLTLHAGRGIVKSLPCGRPPDRAHCRQACTATTRRGRATKPVGQLDVPWAFFVEQRGSQGGAARVKPENLVDGSPDTGKPGWLDAAHTGRRQVDRHRVRRAHPNALVGLRLRHSRLAHTAETLSQPSPEGLPCS